MPSQTEVAYKQRFSNTVEGLALNPAVIPNPYGYQSLCFEALDAVRTANNYRPKIYAVPDQTAFGSTGLAPFNDFITQVRMLPGTLIIGMSLTVLNYYGSPTAIAFNPASNFYVAVNDDTTGIPLFSDWLGELLFNVPTLYNDATHAARPDHVNKTAWLPLTKPRPILTPGIVTVTMCYKGTPGVSQNIAPQLLLQCAEPCDVIRGVRECQ
jgi:hypothetical protein